MDAVLKGELACMSIDLEKRHFEPDEKEFSVYHWLDDMHACITGEQSEGADSSPPLLSKAADAAEKMRPNQEARIACRQIAKAIWKDEPDRRIDSVVRDELIQKYGGGGFFNDDTVRDWVKVVAPPQVRNRRGRPKKGGEVE